MRGKIFQLCPSSKSKSIIIFSRFVSYLKDVKLMVRDEHTILSRIRYPDRRLVLLYGNEGDLEVYIQTYYV